MSKFAVDDRVRVTGYKGTPWHGLIGVVSEKGLGNINIVKFAGVPHRFSGGGFHDDDLEPVVDEPKFKPGDKVRARQRFSGLVREGTVFYTPLDGECVRYSDQYGSNWDRMKSVDFIEFITTARTYPIGARVRIVKARKPHKALLVGKVAVVERHYADSVWLGDAPALLRNDDGSENPYVWFDDELEPVTFAVGDKVSVTCTSGCCVDRKGVVIAPEPPKGWSVRFDDGSTLFCRESRMRLDNTVVAEAVTVTAQPEGIVRFHGAVVAGMTFHREGDDVSLIDEDGDAVAAMTLAEFNEVARILNEGEK